ncbi:MAG TPA: CdaR family protein [Candidatus Polarisedimenticolaceae bacterium]|nr:CdaR family protein [Candidatus Polarisedimenticolaceae bacterium]
MSSWLQPLLRNWPWKLLALTLSFAIWIAVTGESRIMQDVNVPLDLSFPERLVPAGQVPTSVVARLRGPENLLRRADLLRLSFPIDLEDAAPGAVTVQLDPGGLRGVPSGIEVLFVEPDRLALMFDERRERSVPVVPALRGRPPAGFTFYAATASPDTKRISGPAGVLQAVERLRTDPIALDGRTEPFLVRVRAVPDNPEVRLLEPDPVEVRVEVDRLPGQKALDVPVTLAGGPPGATASPHTVRALISGPPALLDAVDVSRVRAIADVEGVAPGGPVRDLPLRVEFREVPASDLGRLTVVRVEPARVLVQAPLRPPAPTGPAGETR